MHTRLPAKALPSTGNSLLAALSAAEYRRLQPHLEFVSLPLGKVLSDTGIRVTHGYFPTTGIVSLLTALPGHPSDEIGVVGNEGLVGVTLLLEGEGALGPTRRAVVQSAGYAYRLPAEILVREFFGNGELQQLLLRYTEAMITQVAQIGICNRHHRLAEQLCRWLLLRLDRSSGCDLLITQEQIAQLLGVRREGVTEAAHNLQRAGVIAYRRGSITVLQRCELERRACECYALIGKEYARLLAHHGHHPDHRGMTVSAA